MGEGGRKRGRREGGREDFLVKHPDKFTLENSTPHWLVYACLGYYQEENGEGLKEGKG